MEDQSKQEEQPKEISVGSTFSQNDLVKPLNDTDKILLLKCPKCQGVHFRHAGYMIPMVPYVDMKTQAVNNVSDNVPVQICVNCKTAILAYSGEIHDVTEHVDLKAWEKTEKEAHKATGPGGQC